MGITQRLGTLYETQIFALFSPPLKYAVHPSLIDQRPVGFIGSNLFAHAS